MTLGAIDDKRLDSKVSAGSTEVMGLPPDWVRAFQMYRRFWLNLARSSSLGDEEAKDVVQTVVAAALEQRGTKFESLEHIRNYVARGVLNRAIQWRQRGERTIPMTERIESSIAEENELDHDAALRRSVLVEGLRHLSRRDFELVKLRFFTGLTFQQISDMQGVAVSTLKSREDSAIKKIRTRFQKRGFKNGS